MNRPRFARPCVEGRPARGRSLAGAALLGAFGAFGALAWASCTAPKNEDGELIDSREAQPREALVRSDDEVARDANFKDLRRRRTRLSEQK